MCENEPNVTFLTLAMTLAMTLVMIQSNPSLHSLLSPSWGSFMPKIENRGKITKQILNIWTRSVKIG